ncbi:MAG: serine/threonine-protein kinase [Kofleriaceae bacterium]
MVGARIGNYRLVRMLGRGGMGEVWLGEQLTVGAEVAIKLLRPDGPSDAPALQRFFGEARAVARVRHPGVVQIFDVGHAEDGAAYLVMALLDGDSLASKLASGRRWPAADVVELGRQLASALAAVHAVGVIHRDLKPSNVMVAADADRRRGLRATLLDFGVAKLGGTVATGGGATTGALGTPAYMAPEQWSDAGAVDVRADVYALGALLFEAAAARPPFVVTSMADACHKHLYVAPPALRSLVPGAPVALDALLDRMLAKAPTARPASMAEVEQALATIASELVDVDDVDALGATAPPGAALGLARGTVGSVTPPAAALARGTAADASAIDGAREATGDGARGHRRRGPRSGGRDRTWRRSPRAALAVDRRRRGRAGRRGRGRSGDVDPHGAGAGAPAGARRGSGARRGARAGGRGARARRGASRSTRRRPRARRSPSPARAARRAPRRPPPKRHRRSRARSTSTTCSPRWRRSSRRCRRACSPRATPSSPARSWCG